MPGRNGTGPLGQGPLTGRGAGFCGGGFGRHGGVGCFRALRRGFTAEWLPQTQEEWLTRQKEWLKSRLAAIEEQLQGRQNDA